MFVLKRDRFTRVTNLNLWQQEVHSPLWNVVLCMPHQWNLPTDFMPARLVTLPHQSKLLQMQKSVTPLPLRQILPKSLYRVIVRLSQWFTAVFILLTVQNTVILKMLLKNYSSTMRRSPLSRKPRLLSDLAIAADFSDFFIWRLFRKDLSVNISLTLLQLRRV